jgi:CheY-like chemotaxis protein
MTIRSGGVLFVDDDVDWIELLRIAFDRAGIAEPISGVNDAEAAIRYLSGTAPYTNRERCARPKLVLIDLRLPGMHGLELLKWIRRQPDLAELPVVAVTGMEASGDAQRARELGANALLTKPLLFPQVVQMARKLQAVWLTPTPATAPQAQHYPPV